MLFDVLTETATVPTGLEYRPDFLAASEERGLLDRVDRSEWLTDLSRRVLHFGYKYDYTSRSLDESARIGPLPEWLAQLSHMVRDAASEEAKRLLDRERPFEQAIINEYLPGQGIAPHIDRDCFGPVVATVSLGSAVNMDFCCESTGDAYLQCLAPRSLVLLHGDARSKWRHGIAKRQSDTLNGQKTKRQRRVSITFRTIAEPGSPMVSTTLATIRPSAVRDKDLGYFERGHGR
ncbi:alpha-ketoglutarate-dependent dioxygenase AlkB [Candidatus Poriferisocius sp.]|uniref:alpha-ketoglutarate-dependent dioxygenase AlkB n=1 Tax=Candidatus Poriferisocius sp. TaxID=3101276 RepID=UPI003B025FB4